MTVRSKRIDSLDVFRGLAVIGMLFADFPGSWEHMIPPFQHADWNGLTQTDLVFPFFLFIVGFSITLSLDNLLARSIERKTIILKIFKRTFWIFFIGLTLNLLYTTPLLSLGSLRVLGVLQRIALVYFAAALLHLNCSNRSLYIISISILAGYFLIMTRVPVPGYGLPDLSLYPNGITPNLAAYIDMKLLGRHAWEWSRPFDPEGILSTIPSLVTALTGVLAARWFKTRKTVEDRTISFFITGFILIAAAWLWQYIYPINKQIWSSTFVLMTSGLALSTFAFLYYFIDVKNHKNGIKPLQFFGTNAIAVFIATSISDGLLYLIPVRDITLRDWLFQNLYASWLNPLLASHVYTLIFILFWMGAVYLLFRKGIYLKL